MQKSTFWMPALTLLILFINQSCNNPSSDLNDQIESKSDRVYQKASEYFDTFAERTDWEKLCSFYREDMKFTDIALQLEIDSLWQFKRFYKWDDTVSTFRKLTPDQKHLTVYSLVANDSVAVARGRVNPFYYNDELIDVSWGMEFTIWLYFDEDLKIKRQVDWMEYDPYVLESTIERCRKYGHERTPDWLDLSRD